MTLGYIKTDHYFESYDRSGDPFYYAVCGERVCDYMYDCLLKTVIGHMKEGDKITLHWRKGNQTDYLTKVGLFHDELFILIDRKDKRYQHFVMDSITPDNSARMINPDSWDGNEAYKRMMDSKEQMEV